MKRVIINLLLSRSDEEKKTDVRKERRSRMVWI